MSEIPIPVSVQLRDESVRDPAFGTSRTTEYERMPYAYRFDAELEAMIEAAEGNPLRALSIWFESARTTMTKTGVQLVPGPIQSMLSLPVRQIYVDLSSKSAYRIEADGRLSVKLL